MGTTERGAVAGGCRRAGACRTALRKGDKADGEVTLVLERRVRREEELSSVRSDLQM